MPASLLEPIDKRRVQNWKQRIWVAQFEDGEPMLHDMGLSAFCRTAVTSILQPPSLLR